MTRNRKLRRTLALGLVAVVALATFGFAAENTVPDTHSGDGSGEISGYVVTNVDYVINTDGDPTDIEGVTFDLDVEPGEVFARFGLDTSSPHTGPADSFSAWSTCVAAGTSVSCTFSPAVPVIQVVGFQVVASD